MATVPWGHCNLPPVRRGSRNVHEACRGAGTKFDLGIDRVGSGDAVHSDGVNGRTWFQGTLGQAPDPWSSRTMGIGALVSIQSPQRPTSAPLGTSTRIQPVGQEKNFGEVTRGLVRGPGLASS